MAKTRATRAQPPDPEPDEGPATEELPPVGGTVVDEGGRPQTDEGGRPLAHDTPPPSELEAEQ